jgi:hypothetical protein
MPENVAFYSQTFDALPDERMAELAGRAKLTVEPDPKAGTRSFVYRWRGLTIRCNEMPQAQVPGHLDGFCNFVRQIYAGQLDERGKQLDGRIRYTRLVVGVVIEPGYDESGRADALLGALAHAIDAVLYFAGGLYDKDMKLLLGPDGSFDATADVLGPVARLIRGRTQVELPAGEMYQPTPTQQERYERAANILAVHGVPTPEFALHLADDAAVTLREPAEVAKRALVLSALTFLAGGGPHEQAVEMIYRHELEADASPEEAQFLNAPTVDPDEARRLLWRLEGLWVLAWALGKLELDWPGQMCDVPHLVKVVNACQADPHFLARARLRPKSQILDAVQLTMLIHWAVRDAWVHRRNVPDNLDWATPSQMVPVPESAAAGVVAERHHALNWLIRYGDADWDNVDTPT